MADNFSPDRASIEIKNLLRKLHPDQGNHKDRVRKLSKFRNYVIGDGKGNTPEFYDDDMLLFFLGSSAPKAYLDDNYDAESLVGMYGLLQACGTPSGDHDGTLKRSARPAMNLLKWLLLDYKEVGQKKSDNNIFTDHFLRLEPSYYHHINLELHVAGDDRGGAKEDACQVVVLILTKHLAEDGEQPQPVTLEELMSNPKAQQEFEIWSARNLGKSVQDAIKKNADARQAELLQQRKEGTSGRKSLDGEDLDNDDGGAPKNPFDDDDDDDEEEDAFGADDTDVMAAFRKQQKSTRKVLKEAENRGEITASQGVAVRWEDSQLAREQRARASFLSRNEASAGGQVQQHETVRDSQEAAAEAAEREEEKARVVGKDPLSIETAEDFDLRVIETSQAEQMEQALHEFQEQLQKEESGDDVAKKVAAQKESFEALVERMGGIDTMENSSDRLHSVLPTDPKFDPMLFLTLVHRKVKYEDLNGSLGRLSSKTENQVEQLQNLVRENFPLFVRCAEGYEEFRQKSENEVGIGVNERIDKLEGIAETCAFQAKKSFKPLLDNTSEVRKVQSAMTVLQRVAPILQVPAEMRQHIENKRYSDALKTYRRVMVVDSACKIELLIHVKLQAELCVRETRRDLEHRIAQQNVSVEELMDGIRDLSELLELDVSTSSSSSLSTPSRRGDENNEDVSAEKKDREQGIYRIGDEVINVREHPPALACLLLQAAHFSFLIKSTIDHADSTCHRIFAGESLSDVQTSESKVNESGDPAAFLDATPTAKGAKSTGNQWKYDVLDARVLSTIKAVGLAVRWLPRLVRVGTAAREDEKRRAARIGLRRKMGGVEDKHLTAFEVFITNITPSVTKLVEHAAFCALGSNTRSDGKDVVMTFGQSSADILRALLRSPLPPTQSTKVGKELAQLVEVISMTSGGANALRPEHEKGASFFKISPLDECKVLGDSAVITIEKRRCIYSFDVCARACSNRGSGSGKLDADSLLNCLQNLSEQLSRPEECANEVERGCELVIRRCCEGLASYVRDRGDSARLSAVAECADVMSDRIEDVVREVSLITTNAESVQEVMMEDIMGLESAMFDEYLESIRLGVADSVRLGWLDTTKSEATVAMTVSAGGDASIPPSFPPYLSASLLAIVRCRAQVEQALGDKIRRSEGVPYQHLSMATVADGVVERVCSEIKQRKLKMKVRQADRLANELEFLRNTLRRFLSGESLAMLKSTLNMVSSKAGRGRDYQGDGPDGLAALEELERLGRVYVLCLGE